MRTVPKQYRTNSPAKKNSNMWANARSQTTRRAKQRPVTLAKRQPEEKRDE